MPAATETEQIEERGPRSSGVMLLDCWSIVRHHGQTPHLALIGTEQREVGGVPCSIAGFVDCLTIVHGGLFPIHQKVTESDVGQVFNGWRYMGTFMEDEWFQQPPAMDAHLQQTKAVRRVLEVMLEPRALRARTEPTRPL